jgi:hypothetical protein
MAEDTTLTSETWLVAIDIGKASHAVLVEGTTGSASGSGWPIRSRTMTAWSDSSAACPGPPGKRK